MTETDTPFGVSVFAIENVICYNVRDGNEQCPESKEKKRRLLAVGSVFSFDSG
jgi:hypothetical protein